MKLAWWGSSIRTTSSHPSESDLRRWRDATQSQESIALRCRICDSEVQYLRHSRTEQCLFCGSEDLTVISSEYLRKLRDVEHSGLSRVYYEPKICFEGASAIIAEFSGIDSSHLDVRGAYFPVWDVLLNMHCVWEGECSVRTSSGRVATWRPQRGVHDYQSNEIRLPVAPILAEAYVVTIAGGTEWAQIVDGSPGVTDAYCIVLPTLSQTEAWRIFHGDAMAQKEAYEHCKGYCERLKSVKAVVQSKHFSLVYLPVALVCSRFNGKDQGYFVNLLNGTFGEIQASAEALT
jgi:hypothetical protein